MTAKQEVFVLLQEKKGSYLSGEELAGKLRISRNAVWKAISALREEGHKIDAVTKRGYCLLEEAGQVSEGEICGALAKGSLISSVEVLSETDSTNRAAKELAVKGAAEGTLLVAKRQSMGKGRLGRSFFSPEGGIYMSAVLRPRIPAERAVLITTCAAVAVARAIEKETGLQAGIKWVNDIFIEGKKVCGILTEAGLDFESGMPEYVILGIGINVEQQSVPEDLKDIVGCLESFTQAQIAKSKLIAAVWNEFSVLYEKLGDAEYMKEYKERSILLGKEVTVLSAGGNYTAAVCDIDAEGHLIIETERGIEKLSSGEVSVRV
ncbi:MAG: biotin--[Lachnospiraceae bacterium]|nr:biotin--[acetyl-CoA-carboxylase] ligase [Lachnospiraceae bacterium]